MCLRCEASVSIPRFDERNRLHDFKNVQMTEEQNRRSVECDQKQGLHIKYMTFLFYAKIDSTNHAVLQNQASNGPSK